MLGVKLERKDPGKDEPDLHLIHGLPCNKALRDASVRSILQW